jgi:dCMP deaminase
MNTRYLNHSKFLDMADLYSRWMSGCRKVEVGSIIVKDGKIVSFGANRSLPDLCKTRGCLRVEKYGDNAKEHRLPSDCRALHSEIDAICFAHCDIRNSTIYVTRYPCEACARAVCAAGITTVVYGRQQEISEETKKIFADSHVEVIWEKSWDREDVNT